MDPVTALMLGSTALSGIGALGGLFGAGAQRAAIHAQNDIALRNYYLQQRLARLQEEMARAGQVDARGNVVEYVPGVGWVTRPSPQTDALIRASDAEARQQLVSDAMRNRLRREANFARQQAEGAQADALLAQAGEGGQSLPTLRAAMLERNLANAMSGIDDMRGRIGLVSLRQGTGGEAALARLGQQGMLNARSAIADANFNAPVEFVARRADRLGSALNQYNLLASRATAPDDVPFQPEQITTSLDAAMRSRANVAPQALGAAMSLKVPEITIPENRFPVALDSLGQYLAGLARRGQERGWFNRGTREPGGFADMSHLNAFDR